MPLVEGALRQEGRAFLDVISPCATFDNHIGSTKRFDFVREHDDAVDRLDVMPPHRSRSPPRTSPAR